MGFGLLSATVLKFKSRCFFLRCLFKREFIADWHFNCATSLED